MTSGRMWMIVALVALALLTSVAWSGLELARHLAGHTRIQPMELTTPPVVDARQAPRNLASISALALFGQSIEQEMPAETDTSRTSLGISLHGVLIDPDPMRSRAFVRSGGVVGVYRVGDEIEASELISVGTETITVLLGDDQVVIGFEGLLGSSEGGLSASDTSVPKETSFSRLAAAIVPGQGSIDLRDPPPPETTEDYIDLWRDRITRNPQDAMNRVGIELVENGYRVRTDPNIGVTLAGLRPGDVITSLNGQSVGDMEQDRILYDDVAAAGIARLEVVRDGQTMLLTFPLR